MNLWANIKDSALAREAATMATGNMLAQGVSLLAYLILTRIFSPTDYALFNIFYSYIEVLIILSTCKYELAVVVAKDETETAAVARFALHLNTVVSLLMLVVVTVLYLTGCLPGNFSELGPLVLLIPPMVFFSGTSRIYASLFNRVRRYKVIVSSVLTNSLAGSLLKILFGLLGMHRSGMPLGTVLGQGAANLIYRFRMRSLALPVTSRRQEFAAARSHRNFPCYVASRDFIDSLTANLPFLWLALYFDKAEVGLFALALTFSFRPVNLLCGAFERVLYARVAEGVRQHLSVWRPMARFMLAVNAVALPVAVVMWFVAEPLFTFLFGADWTGCGVYVRAILPWIYISLNSATLMFVSNIFSTQRTELFISLALFALRFAAVALGFHLGSFITAIRLYATARALGVASLLLWYLWQVRRYERGLISCA